MRIFSSRSSSLSDECLSAYLDGRLSETERRRVEARLAADPQAARRLEQLRYTVETLKAVPRVPLPRAFTLSEAVVRSPRRRRSQGWLQPVYLRGLAGALAVLLMVLVVGSLALPGGFSGLAQAPTGEQLAAVGADASAVSAKGPTEAVAAGPTPAAEVSFLGLSPAALVRIEVLLALSIVVLLVVSWRVARPG